MKRIYFIFSIFCCIAIAIAVQANQPSIVISEINATAARELEWIEVSNISDFPVDMTGWVFFEDNTNHRLTLVQGSSTIKSGEYAIIAQDAQALLNNISIGSTTVFDSSWGSLKESGEEIGLYNQAGEQVELFHYITSTKHSLERINLKKNDYTSSNWKEHPENNSIGKENYWSQTTSSPVEDPLEIDPVVNTSTVIVDPTGKVILSEIFSNPSDGKEWIELYNPTTGTIVLTNWELHDGKGLISVLSIDVLPLAYYVIELNSAKLNNGGDAVILYDTNGNVIDELIYGNWEGSNISAPGKDESLALYENSWHLTASTTPGLANIISIKEETKNENVNENINENEENTSFQKLETDKLYINELVSDPTDDAVEFVEIYYAGQEIGSLAGFYIEDGSEAKTMLSGTIEPDGYIVIKSPKGKLNNAGDIVRLLDKAGSLIDSVTYGNWDDGNTADNALVAKDPYSLARKYYTGNNFNDYVVTAEVTPGEKNKFSVPINEIISDNQEAVVPINAMIVISEILPNPVGNDIDGEFIELYNAGNSSVSLNKWKIGDASKKRFTFDNEEIAAGEYLVLERKTTGIALNNSGYEEVKLFDPNGELHHSLSYSGSVPEGESYIYVGGIWQWTTETTPGKSNVLKKNIIPPSIVVSVPIDIQVTEIFTLDASDSHSDVAGGLNFLWNMGDGKTYNNASIDHQYTVPGRYTIELTLTDSIGVSTSEQYPIHVFEPQGITNTISENNQWQYLQLSEIMPNPVGSDSAEYIELYNAGLTPLSLLGLYIDDEEGGSKPYKLPDVTIPPLGYYLVHRSDSGIALNNSGDSVRFLNENHEELYRLDYEGSIEGAVYIQDELGNWVWSLMPTPGGPNIIEEADVNIASTKNKQKKAQSIIHTTIQGARQQDSGDVVRVYGVVSVLPGVLGLQYFYIADAGSGIQIYMHSKDFPELQIGQGIVVTGEIAKSQGDVRIKIKEKAQIQQQDNPGITASQIEQILDIEQYMGDLIEFQGEITEVKSSYFYIDDGSEEIKVYLKTGTGISKNDFAVGDLITLTGIVIQTKSDIRILPRSKSDIRITGVALLAAKVKQEAARKQDREVAEKYLTATAGGITSILFGLITKVHGTVIIKRIRQRFS